VTPGRCLCEASGDDEGPSGAGRTAGAMPWKAYALYSQKLVWLLKEALEALKHTVPHPIPKPLLTG